MLRTEKLRKVFTRANGTEIAAVRDATFSVAPGEVFGLLGPNGAGKTTLLRMLATILSPTSGYCWIGDTRADKAPDSIRKEIGFLSGNTKLYARLTAREMLLYFGRLYEMPLEKIRERTRYLAEMLDMGEFLDQRCGTLSTGQSQKVSIARVILHDPKVLILDEPTLGLDILTSRAILEFIQDAAKRGHAIIFSTHYMSEAEILCHRIGLIHQGKMMGVGTKAELFSLTGCDNLHDSFLHMLDEGRSAEV